MKEIKHFAEFMWSPFKGSLVADSITEEISSCDIKDIVFPNRNVAHLSLYDCEYKDGEKIGEHYNIRSYNIGEFTSLDSLKNTNPDLYNECVNNGYVGIATVGNNGDSYFITEEGLKNLLNPSTLVYADEAESEL